jgi:hypothetical protein
MSRVGAIFWLGLAMTACVVMFMINYAVQSLQDDLNKVRKQTIAEQLEIRVLHAEWSYLTQPERLAQLNQQFLSLAPIGTKQLQQTITQIPLRPIPDPPPEEIAVAAAPAPAPAAGLELPTVNASDHGLDTLFAQASGEPQPQPTAPPMTTIALDTPASPPTLPVTTVALTTSVRQTAAPVRPGLDALFAQVASER